MHFNKILTFFSLLILVLLGFFIFKDLKNNSRLSPNILFITQPVTSLNGKVIGIGKTNFYISQTFTNSTMNPAPSEKLKTLTFKVIIDKNTIFTHPASAPFYLFKNNTLQSPLKTSLQDLRVDQMVTVISSKDLRTLSTNQFEATEVRLPTIVNMATGKITEIANKMIKIKGILFNPLGLPMESANHPTPPPPKEDLLSFQVSDGTEIVALVMSNPAATVGQDLKLPGSKKYSLNELQIGQRIIVYSDAEILPSQTSKAVRIEVLR